MGRDLTIHTANILKHHLKNFQRDPLSELRQALQDTLSHGGHTAINKNQTVLISDRTGPQLSEERADLTITAKLFLNDKIEPSLASQAIERLREVLETDKIDNLILSITGTSENPTEEEELSVDLLNKFFGVWKVLEESVVSKKVTIIGVADFSKKQLEQIWEKVTIKPLICQVNIDDCCVLPKDLVAFAKENKIELLTHSDSADFVSDKALHDIFESYSIQECRNANISWIIRYTSLITQRGVLNDKAFLVQLRQEN